MPFGSERFVSLWQTLLGMEKWRRKPRSALELTLSKLAKYQEDFAIMLLEHAIAGNYQGLVFNDTDEQYERYLHNKTKKHARKLDQGLNPREAREWKGFGTL